MSKKSTAELPTSPSLREFANARVAEMHTPAQISLVAKRVPSHLKKDLIDASAGNAILPDGSAMRITSITSLTGRVNMDRDSSGKVRLHNIPDGGNNLS